MKPYFSIIIPVYKVEKYLNDCVNSVLQQTFKNFEIILVDDGSPDNCPAICDDISKNNENVKVIHKQNGGLSSARNAGLNEANGEYVIFLDSDDFYLDDKFLFQAKEKLEKNNSDALVFQRRKFFESTNTLSNPPSEYNEAWEDLNFDELVLALSKSDKLDASAATKITKREFLIKNNLFFKEKIFSEDVEWFFRYIQKLQSITFLNNPVYGYRLREGSITHTIKIKNIQDLFFSVTNYAEQIKNSNLSYKNAVLNYMAYQYFIVIGLCYKFKCEETKDILKQCKKYKWLTKYAVSHKTQKAKYVVQILGVKLASKILGFYIVSKK